MNDPHVDALIYVVEHASDYSLIEIENTTFHLEIQ